VGESEREEKSARAINSHAVQQFALREIARRQNSVTVSTTPILKYHSVRFFFEKSYF
jgi:hypothetical protein